MSNLLEISGKDITELNDSDLRILIGLLCEADYRRDNLSTKGITWGGEQDSADGGLDVVVRDKIRPPKNSFIPRHHTGFQVKKPSMPRSKILPEMKPKDVLRDCIKELITEKGAYIIVSSKDNLTTEVGLKDRINAMIGAVESEDNHQDFALDFFDRNRIASWVRSHPFMILWVRERIGRPLTGWQPFKNWSNPKSGTDEEYLIDDQLKLHFGERTRDDGLSVKTGITNIRKKLSNPGASVRLAGLSGVGKTRLVQALFDERIAENSLNPSLAFYTDISDSPTPDPKTFAEQLILNKTRAILIVDNCPPELHHKLTSTCSALKSTLSLLTIEYDVREDLPEETSVFRLEPSSEDLIEKIILNRFKHISQVDAQTIAKFSGGNARVAISLANTIDQGESISGLKNEELFKRLFQQRHDPNDNLLISAQVCSLVYSFEGTDALSEDSELIILASLAEKTVNELYRDIETLRKRDLVQSRHVWRAVLPHAISNRLAKIALESIPKETIGKAFLENGSERLIKSFARRLSYLHDCEQAVEIVNEWLLPDGFLGKAKCNFNDFGMDIFRNIASVSPEKVLEMIERTASSENGDEFTSKENRHNSEYVRLLRKIAYDPDLFERSINVMCKFALSEDPSENNNSAIDALKSLFYLYLSGSNATIEQRAKVITNLVKSDDINRQKLSTHILDATLETWHFSSSHDFSFGARPRDFGFYPKSTGEKVQWYETFIKICREIAISNSPIAKKVQGIITNNIRGLWSAPHLCDAIEKIAIQIHEKNPWNEGWIALRGIIKYDKTGMAKDVFERLCKLEEQLRPDSLLELARTYALIKTGSAIGLEDVYDDKTDWDYVYQKTEDIGKEVAVNPEVLDKMLPELFTPGLTRLRSFGRGLAIGRDQREELWDILYSQFEKTDPDKRYFNIFVGYLSGLAETAPDLYNSILDRLVKDKLLGEWFPNFQVAARIDQRGVERLNESLELGLVKVESFHSIAMGRSHEPICDDDLAVLIRKIHSRDSGIPVALEILTMRFHRPEDKNPKSSESLLKTGRDILSQYKFSNDYAKNAIMPYQLEQISKVCLAGEKSADASKKICENFAKAIIENFIYIPDYSNLFSVIAKFHPSIMLDTFLGNDDINVYKRKRIFNRTRGDRENPLVHISDEDIIAWCDIDPEKRYVLISAAIQGFKKSEDKKSLEWRPVLNSILEKAPDKAIVLDNLIDSFKPMSWIGSRADIIEERSELLKEWFEHENEEIRSMAKIKYTALQKDIKDERLWETDRSNRAYESFE